MLGPRKTAEATHIRAIKSIGAHSLGVVILLVARIVYPPLYLRAWGLELYGEWLILSSAVLYLLLADFGGQIYVGNRMADAYAKGDRQVFKKLLHTGMAAFFLVPAFVFLLFVAFAAYFSVWSILSVVKTPHQTIFWVLAILALQVCISLPLGIVMGVYRAVGMVPRSAMLNNLNQLLQLTFVSGGLWFGLGMAWIALAHLLPVLLIIALSVRELNRLHPEFNILSMRSADWRTAREFIKPSAHFFSIQLSQAMTVQSVLLIVGAILSSAQVVLFSALRTVANSIRQVLAIFINSVWPDMTRFYATGEVEKLERLFQVVLRSTLVAAIVFIGIFHYLGEWIFHVWLGENVAYQQVLMDLFLAYIFQFVFWTSCSNLLMSINRHHEVSILLLIAALLTTAFVFAGGKVYGLGGIVSGLVIADLALPFWAIPILLRRYVPGITLGFYLRELAPALCAIGLVMWTPWAILIVGAALPLWLVQALPREGAFAKFRFLRRG